jgi:hypothetical protein
VHHRYIHENSTVLLIPRGAERDWNYLCYKEAWDFDLVGIIVISKLVQNVKGGRTGSREPLCYLFFYARMVLLRLLSEMPFVIIHFSNVDLVDFVALF